MKVHRRQWPLGIVSDYSRVFNFSEGLACVEVNREYGFIDKAGSLAIPAIYDGAKPLKKRDQWEVGFDHVGCKIESECQDMIHGV